MYDFRHSNKTKQVSEVSETLSGQLQTTARMTHRKADSKLSTIRSFCLFIQETESSC